MALAQTQLPKIEKLVAAARALLLEEYKAQVESVYGIRADGSRLDLDALSHLDDDDMAVAGLLRQRLDHLEPRYASPKAAVDSLIREQAFTTLNRFCALRLAERRGMVLPALEHGTSSEGFRLYQQTAGKIPRYELYRTYIASLFDELSVELQVLFDRYSGTGLLFPREQALDDLVALLTKPEVEEVWEENETIGWIYQYFNDADERKKMRKAGAPRNSRELAVRNQFFTPHYVVRFLVENSLGRMWYEMRGGDTPLKEKWEYLAVKPDEELNRRRVKDPRELKVLDPACGSMHFGLYAFEVLADIYLEAWEENCGSLREDYPSREELVRELPVLLLERNLYGIDIDPRAVQISGLALWLAAHSWWESMNVDMEKRPRIWRANLVAAAPMPGEREYFDDVMTRRAPEVVKRMADAVWEELKLADTVGSLLQVDRRIERELEKAKKAWEQFISQEGGQLEFFEELHTDRLRFTYGYDVKEISQMGEWEGMEHLLFNLLEEFASEVSRNGDAYQRSLFREDAAAGFAFIDLLRHSYDVVLMNPPFGESAKAAKGYITKHYPRTKNDLYAAFTEAFLHRLVPGGYLGAITSRTGFFLSSFKTWREEILLGESRPVVMADLGFGVLDAMVETAAYVLERKG
jgi:hypothetical protein